MSIRFRTVQHHQGHTLLELVIALALGLALMGAGLPLYQSQHLAWERLAERAQMTDAGFSALQLISAHVHLAGFSPPSHMRSNAALFGCQSGRPVRANNIGSRSICQPDRTIHSDGLEVRYAADSISTWPASNGRPTDCLGQAIFAGQTSASSYALAVNQFFVRKSPSTGKTELYCEGNGRPGLAQPLVEGVERLRIRYQLAHTPGWVDAAAIQPAQWSAVTLVDLCVQVSGMRASMPIAYLNCDDVRVMPPDTRLRQTFRRRVALRNQLPRRVFEK